MGVVLVLVGRFGDRVGKQSSLDYSNISWSFYWFQCFHLAIASVSRFQLNVRLKRGHSFGFEVSNWRLRR